MFDIGMPELIVIFLVAIVVLGPKRLPEVAKVVGKGLGELKKALKDVKDSVEEEFKETTSDIRETVADVKKEIESEVKDAGRTIGSTVQEVQKDLETESAEINKTLSDAEKHLESDNEGMDKKSNTASKQT